MHTFRVDETNGTVAEIGTTSPSIEGAGPRHAVIHPFGNFMYVIDEEGLRVDQFVLNTCCGERVRARTRLGVERVGACEQGVGPFASQTHALAAVFHCIYTKLQSN